MKLQLDTGVEIDRPLTLQQAQVSGRSALIQLGMCGYNMMPDERAVLRRCCNRPKVKQYDGGPVWKRKCV